MNAELTKNLKYNLTVNILDGAFFGFAMGFASFTTVLPLFVSNMTDSALLIGLIPAIHNAGWQFPQLFTVGWIARQKRYKPLVVKLTLLERFPFLALAGVALILPAAGSSAAGIPAVLLLTYTLLVFQGLGAGLTANPWTTMVGKIIPGERRGTFFGVQSAAANALGSLSAIAAGILLENLPSPLDFSLCFLLCSAGMGISLYFLNRTREPEHALPDDRAQEQLAAASAPAPALRLADFRAILKRDHAFRWFLFARMISQFALMASAFYTVYAVRRHGASELLVGGFTSVMLGAMIAGNVLMGWIGDRWNRKGVMEFGLAAAALSALLAWAAPSAGWFYLVYALAAIGNVAVWTIGIAMSLEFGTEAERPAYIGMANTLIAPANILAPIIGGWLANLAGYPAAFVVSAAGSLAALVVFQLFVVEKRKP